MNAEIEIIQKSSGGMLCVVCPKRVQSSVLIYGPLAMGGVITYPKGS